MSYFEARISDKQLASLCRRLSTSLQAGLDILGVVEREMNAHTARDLRQRLQVMYDELRNNGATFAEAVKQTGGYFPPVFCELVQVGDETGHLPETLRRLAENFETRVRMRRTFLAATFWPLFQLGAALFVVSVLILVQGILPVGDLLGLGLSGVSGFCIFWLGVGVVGLVFWLVLRAVMRGMLWVRPLQILLLKIPVIGTFLEAVAMGNLAWAMSMTFNTGLDVRRSIPLSLNATNNSLYSDVADEIVETAAGGQSLYDAFSYARVFPGDFMDTLRIGEESGELPEAMAHFSERCRDTATTLLQRLAVIGGFIIWMIILGIILLVIIQLALHTIVPYYKEVNELSRPGAY